MLKTELKIAFPFYKNILKQHRNRPQNVNMQPYGLYAPGNRLLSFQIARSKPASTDNISVFRIVDLDGNLVIDLLSKVSELEIKQSSDTEYITYKGSDLALNIPSGMYYLQLQKGSEIFYSETFKVSADINNLLKIQWWNNGDLAPIMYQTGFKNEIYLDTYIEAFTPEIKQDGDTNGNGDFVPTFQRLVHKHKFEDFLPDYLLDALALAQIHDNVFVTENGETVQCTNGKSTATYSDNYLGTVRFEFEVPGAYVNVSCGQNISLLS